MTKWNLDQAHSEIGFKVKHLMVSTVRGQFASFEGSVTSPDEDFTKAEISFSAEAGSITTNNAMRDEHLKSPEFFNVAEFPTLSFKSTGITRKGDTGYEVTGEFTMRGVTKSLILDAIYNGTTVGMDGAKVAGFEVTGTLSRKDFGLTWNAPTEAGGVVVSDEVKLEINAEFKEVK